MHNKTKSFNLIAQRTRDKFIVFVLVNTSLQLLNALTKINFPTHTLLT